MDYDKIIDYYYPADTNPQLREILLVHSTCVATMAVEICRRHPELHADEEFVRAAAMLHDIGIVRCNAAGIHCHGSEPYLRHGLVGAEMLREYAASHPETGDIEPYARVCARHTGTGLTAESIKANGLPLPAIDLRPETMEEQIVCYADKFYSKTHPETRKTYEQACRSLKRFGEEGLEVFSRWHGLMQI